MGTYHLYTGDDGETHVEPLDLSKHPEYTQFQKVAGFWLATREPGPAGPFRVEPAKRWMTILSGKFEVGLGDGSKHQFGPGDIRFIEDTTGHGHTSQFLEPTVFSVVEVQEGYGPGDR